MNAPLPLRCPSQPDGPPYGLRSLWDMLKLNAHAFYRAGTFLSEVHARLSTPESAEELDSHLDEDSRRILRETLAELDDALVTLDTKVTRMANRRLLYRLGEDKITWREALSDIEHINSRLRDELSTTAMFVLERDKTKYFEPVEPLFGKDVEAQFATASYEIDEAAKCIALDRSTAAVFHLMRVLETGIEATRKCLGIPDSLKTGDRNWGAILRKIKDAIVGKTWTNAKDRELFEAVYVTLDAVRTAWRNTTMHVENKYTDEEAEHVFISVRAFMRNLASRCDENGEPKA